MAISSNESRDGNHAAALAYLEEVRGFAGSLDDRRRASYFYDLAFSYRETGDFERRYDPALPAWNCSGGPTPSVRPRPRERPGALLPRLGTPTAPRR